MPGLHQEKAQHKALGADILMPGQVIERDITAGRRQGAKDDHQDEDQQQHEQVQRIEPDQPGAQERAIAPPLQKVFQPVTISMGEDEAGQDEEELNPQITARGDAVEP